MTRIIGNWPVCDKCKEVDEGFYFCGYHLMVLLDYMVDKESERKFGKPVSEVVDGLMGTLKAL